MMKRTIILLFLLLFAATCFAEVKTVKTSGGDYDDIIDCLNGIDPTFDHCEVYDGTYPGGIITQSGDDLDNYLKAIPASGQTSITISSGITFGTNDYIQIGEYVNGVRNGFTFTSTSMNCSPGGSYITLAGNTWVNQGHFMNGIDCNNVLIEGNHLYSDPPTNNDGDFFQIPDNSDVSELYRVVFRNNELGPRGSGNPHVDVLQDECWTDADHGYYMMEGNIAHDISGTNQHFYLAHCSGGTGSTVDKVIIRYNIWSNAARIFFNAEEDEAGDVHNDMVVYNNTLAFATGTHQYEYLYQVTGTALAPNNLLYDYTDLSNVWGDISANRCPNNYVEDPDGTVSFNSGGCLNANDVIKNPTGPTFSDADPESSLDFSLDPDSQAINAGRHLTLADGSGSDSTSLTVDDPIFFQDGWAGIDPDCIAVGTVSNTACIVRGTVNYTSGAMTLDTQLTWDDNANIWLYKKSDGEIVLYGSAPDIGAEEYTSADQTPPSTSGHDPAKSETDVAKDTDIVVIIDDAANSVDIDTIVLTEESNAHTCAGAATGDKVLNCASYGGGSGYTVTYDPAVDYGYSQVVDVEVDADDDQGNSMSTDSYNFTITTEPPVPKAETVSGSGGGGMSIQ